LQSSRENNLDDVMGVILSDE